MSGTEKMITCDGLELKRLVLGGMVWLEANRDRVNQLNVFPVPDGDTGTNMYLTMRKAVDAIADLEEPHAGKLSKAVAQGTLLGARGNSGVILSQWWRGFSEVLESHERFDAPMFAQACQNAVERAYKAVVKPVEGTILTVTRQAMEAVIERARSEADLSTLFEAKVNAAYESLRHTPDLLPILRDAGVVDSGGQGWTFIIEGMTRALKGEDMTADMAAVVARPGSATWQEALVPEDEEGYGYDVQFLMHGSGMDVAEVRRVIDAMGWSTLVVGDEKLIKVHVHVHDPGVPISYAIQQGSMIDDVVVENMQLQYHGYVESREQRETLSSVPADNIAVVTVAVGDGLHKMFANDLGAAHVIAGGQTMNPSIEDFVNAVAKLPHQRLILLPNNPNVLLAARQAASMIEDKQVMVVPSRTIPQGIAAMIEYTNEAENDELDSLVEIMSAALKSVTTGEITTATRGISVEGVEVREGQYIGLIDDKLVVSGDTLADVTRQVLQKAGADKRELITLYYGEQMSAAEAQELADALSVDYSDQEFQVVSGGQPLYPVMLGIE